MESQLTIDSAEARELAEDVARATGESLTDAVLSGLRLRKREIENAKARDARLKEVDFYALIAGSRMRWKGAMLSLDHGDILYDEYGLPR